MANKVRVETSGLRDIQEADVENIPPRGRAVAGMSKPDMHVEAQSSFQSSGESQSLSDTCNFATPAAAGGSGRGRSKARISGLQSALTPILKYMNIGMKRLPVDPAQPGNNPHQTVPFFSFGNAMQPSSVNQHPNSDLGGLSLMSIDAPVQWLDEEYFPEITLLDVTCDTTMQLNRTPATPASTRELVRNPEHDVDMNWNSKMRTAITPKMAALSPAKNMPPLDITQDLSSVSSLKPNEPSSEVTDQILSQPGALQSSVEELSSTLPGNITHTINSFHEQSNHKSDVGLKACLELTRNISMSSDLENSRLSIDTNGQNSAIAEIKATMTHDTNSSDMSGLCVKSQNATFDMQPKADSKNVTTDLNVYSMETPVSSKENNRELLTEPEVAADGKHPTPQVAKSVNSTFTTLQLSQCSTTTLDTTSQTSCPQNQTLDLPASNVSSSSVAIETVSASTSSTETAVVDQNGPTAKTSSLCDVQNTTFDRQSLQKSSEGAGLTVLSPQSNAHSKTPCKPNCTITMSETTPGDCHQTTFDKDPSPDVCNGTTCPEPSDMDVPPPEPSMDEGTINSLVTNPKTSDTLQNAVEANPHVEEANGVAKCEAQDQSPSARPAADGLSDTPGRLSLDMHNNQGHTFNLDDTLDLKSDFLITSTPMPNTKMFEFTTEREQAKSLTAQKKLYGDAPTKPVYQATSDIPSNIVCNRKTFLTQPAVKSLLPPLKTAPHLLKYKPATLLPGRFEPLLSGLPMTRQRALAETVTPAAPDVPRKVAGVSSSYNLRATTAGSKTSNSGLRRPQQSGLPSGIQKVASSLRPPSARNNQPASSNTVKSNGTTAPNSVAKTSQTVKHPLTRTEALPAKKKKMDSPSSVCTEATTSASDATNNAKNLRQPANCQKALPPKPQKEDGTLPASTSETVASCDAASRTKMLKLPAPSQRAIPAKTQSPSCANCITLEQQLKVKSEEIERLKEELLRYTKGEEEC